MSTGIVRARHDLAAARLLSDEGFAAQAVSRAFHAACHAAEAALFVLDETRSGHPDVVSAFVRRVVRERALDPHAGALLRSLLNRAELADASYEEVPAAESAQAVEDAAVIVETVVSWLADPARSSRQPGRDATRLPARPLRPRR